MGSRIVLLLATILGLCAGKLRPKASYARGTPHGGVNSIRRVQELMAVLRTSDQLATDVDTDQQSQALLAAFQSLKAVDQANIFDLAGRGTASPSPSSRPTTYPTAKPSSLPSDRPSLIPSAVPSDAPSYVPSEYPSSTPSQVPSLAPSDAPSDVPSDVPSSSPSTTPTLAPSALPTVAPAPADLAGNSSSGPTSVAAITGFSVAGAFLLLGGVIVGRRVRTATTQSRTTGNNTQTYAMDEEEGVDLSIVEGPQPSDITGSVGVLTPRYGSASGDEVDRYFNDDDCSTPRRAHRNVEEDDELAMTGPFPAPVPYSPYNKKHQAIATMINSQADSGFRRPSGLFSCPEERFSNDSDSEHMRASKSL